MQSKNRLYPTAPRGGFSVSNSNNKISQFKAETTNKGAIDKIKGNASKGITTANALSRAHDMLKVTSDLSNLPAGKMILTIVSNGILSALNNSKSDLPGYIQNSVKSTGQQDDSTKVHVVRFHVGMKSTSSVVQAEKQNGSVNIQLNNSIADSIDSASRGFLSRAFGFNMKSFDFLNESFYGVVLDYEKLYNISKWELPEHSRQVPYGLVKSEYLNLKIRNSNSYHRMNVKIHVVKMLDDDRTLHSLYKSVFSIFNTKTSKFDQKPGAIPIVYQISNENPDEILQNKFMNSTTCHLGTGMSMSAAFKTQAKIVKTFKKTLNPGDTFDFRMTQHCGPGLRFDISQVYLNNVGKGLQPSGYALIIETEGTACEAVRTIDNCVFQGTSPGWYNYEFTKGVTLVRNSTIISDSSELSSNLLNKYAIKVHERQFTELRPLTIQAKDIGSPTDSKPYKIVSLSNEQKSYAAPINQPKNTVVEIAHSFDESDADEEEVSSDE